MRPLIRVLSLLVFCLLGCAHSYRHERTLAEEALIQGDLKSALLHYQLACYKRQPNDPTCIAYEKVKAEIKEQEEIARQNFLREVSPKCQAGKVKECVRALTTTTVVLDKEQRDALLGATTEALLDRCQTLYQKEVKAQLNWFRCLAAEEGWLSTEPYLETLGKAKEEFALSLLNLAQSNELAPYLGAQLLFTEKARQLDKRAQPFYEKVNEAFLSQNQLSLRVEASLDENKYIAESLCSSAVKEVGANRIACSQKKDVDLLVSINAKKTLPFHYQTSIQKTTSYQSGTQSRVNPEYYAAQQQVIEAERALREVEVALTAARSACSSAEDIYYKTTEEPKKTQAQEEKIRRCNEEDSIENLYDQRSRYYQDANLFYCAAA